MIADPGHEAEKRHGERRVGDRRIEDLIGPR